MGDEYIVSNTSVVVYQPDETSTPIEFNADIDHRTVWASQRQIAGALSLTIQSVSSQVQNFKEQRGDAAERHIKQRLITAADGKQYQVEHYDTTVIAFVGFRAKATERTIAFQDWVGAELDKLIAQREKALTPAQQALMHAQILVDHERQLTDHEQRIHYLEASVQRSPDYYTVIGYYRHMGLGTPSLNEAQSIGQRAKNLSVKRGVSVGKTTDPRFGEVNTYHESILNDVLKGDNR